MYNSAGKGIWQTHDGSVD